MQNLSASDMLSLGVGFRMALEEADGGHSSSQLQAAATIDEQAENSTAGCGQKPAADLTAQSRMQLSADAEEKEPLDLGVVGGSDSRSELRNLRQKALVIRPGSHQELTNSRRRLSRSSFAALRVEQQYQHSLEALEGDTMAELISSASASASANTGQADNNNSQPAEYTDTSQAPEHCLESSGVPRAWRSPVRIQIEPCNSSEAPSSGPLDEPAHSAFQTQLRRQLDPQNCHLSAASSFARSRSTFDLVTTSTSSESDLLGKPASSSKATHPIVGNMDEQRLLLGIRQDIGSLSDSSLHRLTKYARPPTVGGPFCGYANKRELEERFRSWKRSNRYSTHVHKNPFNLNLDCLNRLNGQLAANELEADQASAKPEKLMREQMTQTTQTTTNDHHHHHHHHHHHQQQQQQQPNDLNNYANNLTHLYRKNQRTMDSSNDFRTLLYNIICCLLVQDEQVLSTPSVGKMLEVIRTHLESASRVYVHTSAQLVQNLAKLHSVKPHPQKTGPEEVDATSLGGCSSSSTSVDNATNSDRGAPLPPSHTPNTKLLKGRRTQKPADFRRVSSVSYNDEQLINDLCDDYHQEREANSKACRSGSLSGAGDYSPSPWAYQELSERRQSSSNKPNSPAGSHVTNQYTSQSSLEMMINVVGGSCSSEAALTNTDLMDDSGNGTLYEYQVASDMDYRDLHKLRQGERPDRQASQDFSDRAASVGHNKDSSKSGRRQQRRLLVFKPMQQPSYMSTDDYLSTSNNYNNRTSFYDDEPSSTLQKYDFNGQSVAADNDADSAEAHSCSAVDVASRRAELEWTLNRLINIELKLTWLTSKDTLRRAIRKIGLPNEIRGKVWLILIEQMIGDKYDAPKLIELARKTIEDVDEHQVRFDDDTQSILKQIELDVNRTMPGHRLFDDGAEGGVKLRRILVAYSIHVNRAIAYCQGFNFIVALLLSVFEGDEEKALRGFICIVDHIFPSKYYFDDYLTGARADQFLLTDFICDQLIKNPTLAERKMVEGVTSSITLNWFISLFHGAVPTLTRLTILDHFMLEGVKALFRFTMAMLYLAFQVTPPSSCDIFSTIRNTAKDMYDIKLLLSIVDQIKLPKDSYFAIRRSFYMVQSSFNSDHFFMQTLSSEASRSLLANKPLNCQQMPDTKPAALSFITAGSSSLLTGAGSNSFSDHYSTGLPGGPASSAFTIKNSICQDSVQRPRARTSANQSKICIQNIGKLGRSHLRIIDANARANERSLMSPLRNCILIGITNCGKNLMIARQSSKRNFRTFKEHDLTFHIHEISTEIFDGFYLEEAQQALIITHQGEIFKIDCGKCLEGNRMSQPNYLDDCTETLMLREMGSSLADHAKVKLRLSTMDSLTNLLWIYVECEDLNQLHRRPQRGPQSALSETTIQTTIGCSSADKPYSSATVLPRTATRFKHNNPFLDEIDEFDEAEAGKQHNSFTKPQQLARKATFTRKIIIVDIITFDLFSAFAVHPNFGEITNLRASLVAFCQLSNPMSSQFSTRIVQIGPTGRYEQLLSFSDVVDYMVSVPETYRKKYRKQSAGNAGPERPTTNQQRYSTLRKLLTHSISFSPSSNTLTSLQLNDYGHVNTNHLQTPGGKECQSESDTSSTITKYYRSLMKSYSSSSIDRQTAPPPHISSSSDTSESNKFSCESTTTTTSCDIKASAKNQGPKLIQDGALRSIVSSSFGDFSELSETNYIPVNMAFIFRNGKIALFEFTESYAIHTRESQLDRYDYSRVIDVTKSGDDFIVTILTMFDKLIKVII